MDQEGCSAFADFRQLCLITPSNTFIFTPDDISTILTVQTPHRKMSACDVLKMVDKNKIDRGAASCTDYGYGLSGEFLRNGDAESRGDLGNQLDDGWCALFGEPIYSNESGGFRHNASKGSTRGIISSLRTVVRCAATAEREDLEAGQLSFR